MRPFTFIFCAACLVSAVAAAQTAPHAPPALTKAPTVLNEVKAVYPLDAADAGAEATVVLEVDIGVDGTVLDARVVSSAGPAFDRAAVEALRQFIFSPAELDGEPAAVRIRYEYAFSHRPQADATAAAAAAAELRGTVVLAGSREPVGSAQVTVGEGDAALTAVTDTDGAFALSGLASGEVPVTVTGPGLVRFSAREMLRPGERTDARYYVLRDDGTLTTVVRGEQARREVNQVKLTQAEVQYLAGTRGDALKVVQSLPGVARSPFGGGVLVVRGSKSWDSRVYVDEVQVPALFHFAGLTSTFNSALLQDISFQPGNFGVEYGRSIGGLVLGVARTPSKTTPHGYVDLNLFDVSGLVELPIGDAWSVSASARRGLADLVLPYVVSRLPAQAQSTIGFSVAPASFDYQLRAERQTNGAGRLFIGLFGSSDQFAFVQPNPFVDLEAEGVQGSFGNAVAFHRLVLGLDQKLSQRVSFISRNAIGLDLFDQLGGSSDIYFHGRQYPVQLRERFIVAVPEADLHLSFGLDALVVPAVVDAQSTPPFKANQIPDPYVERRLQAEKSTTIYGEPAAFVELTYRPHPSLEIVGGVRVDYETYMKKAWVDPRLSLRWSPVSWLTLKGGAAIYHQPPDYRTGQLSKVFGNPDLLPEGARHYLVGGEVRFTDTLELTTQLYYKDFFEQARATLASGLGSDVNIPGAETRYTSQGYGRAFGGEVLLRQRLWHNLTGWVAYSLSRFERDYYGGVVYAPGPLDQPHNLIAVVSYRLPFDFIVGARFRFASGPLVTPIVASLYDTNGNYYYPLPGLPWSQRLPDFWQLDVRLDKRFVFRDWVLSLYLDVQNVTNHGNVEGVFYNYDYTQRQYVYGILILPALGVRGEF